MKCCLLVCLVGISCGWVSSALQHELPSYLDVCYRDDPLVGSCLKKTIEKLLPIFKSGSKEFELDPLDPLLFPKLDFHYPSALVGGDIFLKDTIVTGLTDMKIVDIRPKMEVPNKFSLDFDVTLPFMNVRTAYKLIGNVITIPVHMDGRVVIDLKELNLTYHLSGDVEPIDGSDYLVLKRFVWRFRGDGIKYADLVNDDVVQGKPALNRIVKTMIKTSWKLLKNQILPAILPEADKSLKETFTRFFKKYPYDILFPKRS